MNEIEVKVTKNGSRKDLTMYWDDPVSGVRKQRSTKKTKRNAANRVAAQWELELRSGRDTGEGRRMTWKQFRDLFWERRITEETPANTRKAFASAFNQLEALVNPLKLSSMTTSTLATFQRKLRATGVRTTTVASYLRSMKSALNWAVRKKLLVAAPDIDMPRMPKGRRLMRGRPITREEYERMLAITPRERPHDAADWQRYQTGLWLSGLRLSESVALSWDDDAAFAVDLAGKVPRFRIYAEAEKGNRDRKLPMTPDFEDFLLATPEAERHGRVFRLVGLKTGKPILAKNVSEIISDIGRRAGVVVDKTEDKHASAHDFRRAFGTRWSNRVKTPRLQRLMRHESINTTLCYYVDEDLDEMAAEMRKEFPPEVRTSVSTSPVPGDLTPEITGK